MPQTEEIKKMDLLFVKREGSSSSDIPALPAAAPLLQLTDGHQDKRKDRGARVCRTMLRRRVQLCQD